MYVMANLIQEFDDGRPITFKRSNKAKEGSNSKKHYFRVIDEAADDTIVESKKVDEDDH